MSKQQIHKRLSEEQIIAILENYLAGEIKAKEARENLGIKKTRFFELVSAYKNNPDKFTIKYGRTKSNRSITKEAEKKIISELKAEQKLIKNKNNPIRFYNYSAIKDYLKDDHGITVSLPTIINRAKDKGYYIGRPVGKAHDREVITNLIGELAQHDSSHHQWSPYMDEKLYLITTIDDHSRLILYAEFVRKENLWAHILALKSVFLTHGCPLRYYADQHSIFRFVRDRDKNRPWNDFSVFTDDISPQWKRVLEECKVNITYALSPQAKGKIERPYRWLQDRIVRIAAREGITTIEELRIVLKELVNKYNTKWVHSTTKEIPIIRFEKAARNKKSLFKTFKIDDPNKTIDDIFCIRASRVVDSYRKVSLNGIELKVPNGRPRYTVDIKMVPDEKTETVKLRFWQDNTFLGEQMEKLNRLPIVRF
jgi:hypothetical protein